MLSLAIAPPFTQVQLPAPGAGHSLRELRTRLAADLRAIWAHEEKHPQLAAGDSWHGPMHHNSRTVRRMALNLFLDEVAKQLDLSSATCIDWGASHRALFRCSAWYEYGYSESQSRFHEATPQQAGAITGSIHDLMHAPSKLLDFALVTEVRSAPLSLFATDLRCPP
jgi:hypothetical protein